ncbi:MAG: hypothetical protein ACHQ5A_15110, partial [Opitutales bacterium]
ARLDQGGLRERLCVVALPPEWIMARQTAVPPLSPEDLTSFLQIEAEKGFPCDPAQLQIARSFCRGTGATHVTQLAVRQEQLNGLTAVLGAADLKPVSFTLGLAALPGVLAPGEPGRITLAAEPAGASLLAAAGGGIAAFRTCEPGGTGNVLARELRITLEQIPAGLRPGLKALELVGDAARIDPLHATLTGWADAAGLTVTRRPMPDQALGAQIAQAAAAQWLEAGSSGLEFLPPRPGRWASLLSRYHSKRLAYVGGAAAAISALVALVFGWQAIRLWTLRSAWGAMQAQVTDLDNVQANIRQYRPWYDTSFHTLSILRQVTACFPDNGSVTAKSFEIHGPTDVSVTGTARDNPALLHMLDLLRKSADVRDLKIEQIRGKAPLQFTLSFHWFGPSGI